LVVDGDTINNEAVDSKTIKDEEDWVKPDVTIEDCDDDEN
jgi:hypothetical protein